MQVLMKPHWTDYISTFFTKYVRYVNLQQRLPYQQTLKAMGCQQPSQRHHHQQTSHDSNAVKVLSVVQNKMLLLSGAHFQASLVSINFRYILEADCVMPTIRS